MHSPVKVNDQVGDAYKQVVNSYEVRRQVDGTLCACELRGRTPLKADLRLGGLFLRSLKAGPILRCQG